MGSSCSRDRGAFGAPTQPSNLAAQEHLGRFAQDHYAILAEVGGGRWPPARDSRPWVRFSLTTQGQTPRGDGTMAGTHASRQRLYRELGELLSQEAMDELMDAIPPVGWGDVARRQDITNLDVALRAEISELRGEMHGGFAAVATEFAAVRTEMAVLRSEFTSSMRLQLFSLLGAMFTLAGLTWAATFIT